MRFIAVAVVAGLIALSYSPSRAHEAQMPTIEVLTTLVSEPIAMRAAGVLISDDAIVPASTPDEAYLRYAVDQDVADRINPAITYVYYFERRSGPEWRHICGGNWVGVDAWDDEYNAPYIAQCIVGMYSHGPGMVIRSKRGWRVRGRIDLPVSTPLGWRIEVIRFVEP